MIKHIKHGLLTLLAIVPLTACSETYTYEGKAIKGQIVDAESKQALEGAVVAALWAKRGGLHTDTIGYVHLDEAVTDSQGYYELKAWGPVEVSDGYMGSFSPDLIVFKQGYKYRRENEGFLPPAKDRRVWTSRWDGEVIELERFEGSIYEYKYHLGSLETRIRLVREGGNCEWGKARRLLAEIYKTEVDIRDKAIKNKNLANKPAVNVKFIHSLSELEEQDKCGNVEDIFEGLL